MKPSTLVFEIVPSNNLFALSYSIDTYKQLGIINNIFLSGVIINYVSLSAGLIFSKIISFQAVSSMQLSFLLISLIYNIPLYLSPLISQYKIINGYNQINQFLNPNISKVNIATKGAKSI
jgi:hypothetical protein